MMPFRLRTALAIGGIVALFALIAWLYIGWDNAASRADDLAQQVREQTARAETAERRENALRQAEAERETDDQQLAQMKDDLTHAIESAPKGEKPATASRALNCERLRRAGLTTSAVYRDQCR